jgi:hypothetical protein
MLVDSYARSLKAQNKSTNTVEVYTSAVRLFADFLTAKGMPTRPADITREHNGERERFAEARFREPQGA